MHANLCTLPDTDEPYPTWAAFQRTPLFCCLRVSKAKMASLEVLFPFMTLVRAPLTLERLKDIDADYTQWLRERMGTVSSSPYSSADQKFNSTIVLDVLDGKDISELPEPAVPLRAAEAQTPERPIHSDGTVPSEDPSTAPALQPWGGPTGGPTRKHSVLRAPGPKAPDARGAGKGRKGEPLPTNRARSQSEEGQGTQG